MIEFVSETESTNADLVTRLRSGEDIAEGYWLLAERQTGGRGRGGREWISPAGNLYASTVVHVSESDPPAHTLSLAIGLAVFRHVRGALTEAAQPHVILKWPNDVLVEGAKVAGILLERCENSIVVGIGVNLAFAPDLPDKETACLYDLNARYTATPRFSLDVLASTVEDELRLWRKSGAADLIRRWTNAAHPIGTPLTFHDSETSMQEGTFAGLAEDGSLLLRLADGSTRVIHAGDIMLA